MDGWPDRPQPKLRCSKCGDVKFVSEFHKSRGSFRGATHRCRSCRSSSYYASRYPETCACCQKNRPLDKNGQCRVCNLEAGLRQCRKCGEIKPLFLSFHGASKVCKSHFESEE